MNAQLMHHNSLRGVRLVVVALQQPCEDTRLTSFCICRRVLNVYLRGSFDARCGTLSWCGVWGVVVLTRLATLLLAAQNTINGERKKKEPLKCASASPCIGGRRALGFYFSFLQNYTHNAFGFWETHKVPGSMICTEPPCTCLSYCFPCNTWRNVSHSKQGRKKIRLFVLHFH